MKTKPKSGISDIIKKQRAQNAPPLTKYQQVMKALGRSSTYSRNQPEPTPSPFKSKNIQAKNLKAKTIGVTPPPERKSLTLKQTLEKQAENQ
jgi:hypothetical protein